MSTEQSRRLAEEYAAASSTYGGYSAACLSQGRALDTFCQYWARWETLVAPALRPRRPLTAHVA